MDKRIKLINDIEFFVEKSMEDYNKNQTVDRTVYFDISRRLTGITVEDFDNEEKYNYFIKYLNQNQRWADRHVFEQHFRDDNLPDSLFLWMSNFLRGTVSWLK